MHDLVSKQKKHLTIERCFLIKEDEKEFKIKVVSGNLKILF